MSLKDKLEKYIKELRAGVKAMGLVDFVSFKAWRNRNGKTKTKTGGRI